MSYLKQYINFATSGWVITLIYKYTFITSQLKDKNIVIEVLKFLLVI